MATQDENKKINELDKKVSLLQNDFGYMKSDISEVKGDIKGMRGDFKELTGIIASLGFATIEDFEDHKKHVNENYVSKITYQKLESKLTPVLWFAGIAASAVVTGIVGAIVVFIINGGLSK